MRTSFEPQSVLHQLPVTDIPAPQSTAVDHKVQFECDT